MVLARGFMLLGMMAQMASSGRPREPYGQCWSPANKKFSAPCRYGNEMCGPALQVTAYHIMDAHRLST